MRDVEAWETCPICVCFDIVLYTYAYAYLLVLGGVHKLRLQILPIFDHLPTSVYIG